MNDEDSHRSEWCIDVCANVLDFVVMSVSGNDLLCMLPLQQVMLC